MEKELKYKGNIITVKFPSGMFEYYSDSKKRFLKFDTLKAAKESIDKEKKSVKESVEPTTQKIKLSEVRQLVKKMLKEAPKKKMTGWPDLSASPDFGEYLGFDTKGGYKNSKSDGGYSNNPEGTYYDTLNNDKKELSDISYLGNWKKTGTSINPNFDKEFAEWKKKYDKEEYETKARKNPINTPPKVDIIPKKIPKTQAKETPKLDNITIFNNYLKNGIDKLIQTKQQKNWASVLSLVNSLYDFNYKYFDSINKHMDYDIIDQKIKNVANKDELRGLFNEMQINLKNSTSQLVQSYDGTYKSVKKLLNDILFYKFFIDKIKNNFRPQPKYKNSYIY
jgi:hypothetical protein